MNNTAIIDTSKINMWVGLEFGKLSFGDKRLNYRFKLIAQEVLSNPTAAITSLKDKAFCQGAYRFFNNDKVTDKSILDTHIERLRARCVESSDWLYCIQDTTALDFKGHKSTEGLGHIGTSKDSLGIMMHTVICADSQGVPLGILSHDMWCRDKDDYGKSSSRNQRGVKEKESNKWNVGLDSVENSLSDLDKNILVVCDRECDIYEYFVRNRSKNIHLLVRASHNRSIDDGRVLESIANAKLLDTVEREIKSNGITRLARFELRLCRVNINRPSSLSAKQAASSIALTYVSAKEVDCADGVDGASWLLITDLDVKGAEGALFIVDSYRRRWLIEEYFHTLKSGMQVEKIQFTKIAGMKKVISLLCISAFRVLFLCKYAKINGDEDALTIATKQEIDALEHWFSRTRKRGVRIRDVSDFVRAIGMLAGYIKGSSSNMPGVKKIWEGLRVYEIVIIASKAFK